MASAKRRERALAQPREGGKFAARQYGPTYGQETPDWVHTRIGGESIRATTEEDRPAPRLRREVISPRREMEVALGPAPRLEREVMVPRRVKTPRRQAFPGTKIQTPWATIGLTAGILGVLGYFGKRLYKSGVEPAKGKES